MCVFMSFPGGTSRKESACQFRRCKRCRFDPWNRKIPWRGKWQPTPVFLTWEIPWTEEPGGLQFMRPQRIGHDWVTEHTCIYIYILRDFIPTLELLYPHPSFWMASSLYINSCLSSQGSVHLSFPSCLRESKCPPPSHFHLYFSPFLHCVMADRYQF